MPDDAAKPAAQAAERHAEDAFYKEEEHDPIADDDKRDDADDDGADAADEKAIVGVVQIIRGLICCEEADEARNEQIAQRTQLIMADLSNADLSGANLTEADLGASRFSFTNLTGADLTGASLWHANLRDAIVTAEQLSKAKSLEGAIMPDGTVHE